MPSLCETEGKQGRNTLYKKSCQTKVELYSDFCIAIRSQDCKELLLQLGGKTVINKGL